MHPPLLDTKLYLPSPPRRLVPRSELCERMDNGAMAKLLLVSAPAGFGKTTLLAEWLATRPAPSETPPVAWLSLDRGDNEPTTFWTYVVAALQTVAPGVGDTALDLLRAPQPVPVEAVLTTLLNDLAGIAGDHLLVLDDYHVVDAPEVQTGMAFLLDHLPPTVHVVIAGRADPVLPLGKLRARGQLAEIRVADLRFTTGEATAYLNGAMGLQLSAPDVAALEDRTEGWIAALQLAALSMQGREDVTGFIAGFAGDDRYVVDYLVEEVLQRQPAAVRDFLLRTSVLSRLSGPLCDAVTGAPGSRAMLETLDRGNLFVVPLDDRRQWYRYHHLFADVLRARLADERPELAGDLHRRASDWYAEHDDRSAAIRHALAASAHDRAADLVELAIPSMNRDRREGLLLSWLDALPDDVVEVRPVLSNGYAGALLASGAVQGVERRLRDAERCLAGRRGEGAADHHRMVVGDRDELRRTPAGIAVHRAGLSLALGDRPATMAHARSALELLVADDDLNRGAATALIGLVSWANGDLEAAYEAYATCVDIMRRAGHVSDVLGCSIALADIRTDQGRLRDAGRIYERALQLASERAEGAATRGTVDMYVGMSALHRERGDLDTARMLLARADELGEHNGLPQNPYRRRVAMAHMLEAEGELTEAERWYDEAERHYVGDFSPNVRPVPSVRARAWLRQGRIDDAFDWARDQGLSAADDLDYLHEHEHVTLARALLSRAERDGGDRFLADATDLLARLRQAAEAGGRTGTVIEVLVLQSLAARTRGEGQAALVPLEHALTLAEPEGYARIFVDEGPAMAAMLKAIAQRGIARNAARRVLSAFDRITASPRSKQGLIDPLSERELDVLRLLGSDLDGPAIARELVVSLHTVRTHTKNIYAKLGVNSRREAVRRADELNLTSSHRVRST